MEEKRILKRLDALSIKMNDNGVPKRDFKNFVDESNRLLNRLKELAKGKKK